MKFHNQPSSELHKRIFFFLSESSSLLSAAGFSHNVNPVEQWNTRSGFLCSHDFSFARPKILLRGVTPPARSSSSWGEAQKANTTPDTNWLSVPAETLMVSTVTSQTANRAFFQLCCQSQCWIFPTVVLPQGFIPTGNLCCIALANFLQKMLF